MTNQSDSSPNSQSVWIQFLSTIELFSKLNDKQLAIIANELVINNLSAGSVLINQGELSERMYILFSGKLTVTAIDTDSNNKAQQTLKPGACIVQILYL